MRIKLLISFLIVALLTAANTAPQFSANTAAWTGSATTPVSQPLISTFPGFTEMPAPIMAKPSPSCITPKGMHGPTAPFKIEVFETKEAIISINGTSRNGNFVIFCSLIVKLKRPVFIELMWGNYVYAVTHEAKISRGSFFINNSDKATMQVFKDQIKIGPFP